MFPRKQTSETSELEAERTNIIKQLQSHTADSDEYKKMMAHVETLSNLIGDRRPKKLDVNTVAVVLGNVGIAGMVLSLGMAVDANDPVDAVWNLAADLVQDLHHSGNLRPAFGGQIGRTRFEQHFAGKDEPVAHHTHALAAL